MRRSWRLILREYVQYRLQSVVWGDDEAACTVSWLSSRNWVCVTCWLPGRVCPARTARLATRARGAATIWAPVSPAPAAASQPAATPRLASAW
jgi:hypothetical protein